VFFEQADNGSQVVIKRGEKQSYILAPMKDFNFAVTPELMETIERARQQMREGKVTVCKTIEENFKFLDSL